MHIQSVLYIDDLVEGMFDLLEGKEKHCEFDGVETVLDPAGRYCCVPVTHKITLGEIVDLLEEFKQQPVSLMMPKMPEGSFAKKLFSLYLSYLPADKFKYVMKMNCDDRGSFTELVHTVDCGQVSINISKPGITKGQHWHNSKWEQFIVGCPFSLPIEINTKYRDCYLVAFYTGTVKENMSYESNPTDGAIKISRKPAALWISAGIVFGIAAALMHYRKNTD